MHDRKSRFSTVRDLYRALEYQVPGSEKALTAQQTGVIDIPSLLQGRPDYWAAPFGNLITRKKIIVVNTANIAEDKEKIILDERLQDLEKKGHRIFRNADVAVIAKKTGSSPDEIITLSKPELRQLMAGDDEDWKQFGVFAHMDLSYSNISKTSLEVKQQFFCKFY